VAWGVVGLYLLIAVEATSLMMKRDPRPIWRQVHRMSFGLDVFATIHGIQAGTDTASPWYQMAMLASINIVAFLVILVILTHRKAARRHVEASRPLAT
jgi:DMSO/TMAO reductase YedYZ heme-binding membrane subunit